MIEIITTFVFPGGCAEKDIGGQRRLVRVCLGIVEDPDRGLLAELDGHITPIPWESKAIREEAIERVRLSALFGDDDQKEKLVEHMRRSKFYGVRK